MYRFANLSKMPTKLRGGLNYIIYHTKNRHIKWGKIVIKNKHQNKQLQIKRASLQMLLM